jgi:phosphoribosylformylglycinamidine cyclo-ligase
MTTSPFDYKSAGVNVAAGDDASHILFEAAKRTWANRAGRLGDIQTLASHFRTFRFFQVPTLDSDVCFGLNFDGIGTKIELAERLGAYTGLASDLLAMICDDAAVAGGEPIVVGSILDMAKVDLKVIRDLSEGMIQAAGTAGVAVINGELAELPSRITGHGSAPFNWGGACLWAGRRDRLVPNSSPEIGDVVIGVAERGFRSNGYTLIRAIFRRAFGDGWGTASTGADVDLVRFAAQPAIIYTPLILSITGGISGTRLDGIKSLVHVTGGGLSGRLLFYCRTNRIGAQVRPALQPPPEMRELLEIGGVEIAEAYRTWNMGVGLIVIASRSAVHEVIARSERFGLVAAEIGTLIADKRVEITFYDGTSRSYPLSGE